MPNKYCNLDGGKLIKDEYSKINVGFDRVSDDMININKRVNDIITTPADSISAQEIIDARGGKEVLNDRFNEIGLNMEQKADKDRLQFKVSNYKTPTDVPSAYDVGITEFYVNSAEWVTLTGFGYACLVRTEYFNINYAIQYFCSYDGTPLKYRQAKNDVWGSLKTIATTDKIDILWSGNVNITTTSQQLTTTGDMQNYDYLLIGLGTGLTDINIENGFAVVKVSNYFGKINSSIHRGFTNNNEIRIKRIDFQTLEIRCQSNTVSLIRQISGVKIGG